MYYGNSYGYGSSCGCQSVNPCYGNYNTGYYGGSSKAENAWKQENPVGFAKSAFPLAVGGERTAV